MCIDKAIVQKVENALKFSTAEGMAYGAVMGFGDNYIVAFAVALQVQNYQIGILCSVSGFLASLAQLGDVALLRRFKSRKSLVLVFALLQGLMFLPMLGLTFFPSASDGWWLILFATIYSISAALVSPVWGSIMAEVVPEHLRGRYFSLRGSLSTLANTVFFMAAGGVPDFSGAQRAVGFCHSLWSRLYCQTYLLRTAHQTF
jgi:MFS family permease